MNESQKSIYTIAEDLVINSDLQILKITSGKAKEIGYLYIDDKEWCYGYKQNDEQNDKQNDEPKWIEGKHHANRTKEENVYFCLWMIHCNLTHYVSNQEAIEFELWMNHMKTFSECFVTFADKLAIPYKKEALTLTYTLTMEKVTILSIGFSPENSLYVSRSDNSDTPINEQNNNKTIHMRFKSENEKPGVVEVIDLIDSTLSVLTDLGKKSA
jgi:hypothetical protein